MGINTGLVITFSYALSSATAAFAGVLIAPLTLTGATMGAVLGLKAFAVAIIGGLTSGMGIIVGGIILGIAENHHRLYTCPPATRRRAGAGAAAVLVVKPAGPVRQDGHQEGLIRNVKDKQSKMTTKRNVLVFAVVFLVLLAGVPLLTHNPY